MPDINKTKSGMDPNQPGAKLSKENQNQKRKTVRPDIGLYLLFWVAIFMAISEGNSGNKELYLLGNSLIGVLVGALLGRMRGALYGLAIGIIVGYFMWFIFTCQFCN